MCPLEYFQSILFNNKQLTIFNQIGGEEGIKILGFGLAIVFLIFCSAFFSSSETAFSTVNIMRLKNHVQEKRRGARKALWIAEHFDRTLSTILVGNNFVNIASTVIATIIFGILIKEPTLANVINTALMTIIILIFGEIIPKCLAKDNSENFSLRFSGLLYFLIKIMYPVVIIFMGIKKLFVRKHVQEEAPTVTEEDLESIIDNMEEEGVIDRDDASLIQSVLDIGERTVNDIMIPRVDFIAIEDISSIDDIKKIFLEYKYSRLPVFKEDKDHIIGVLNEKDFFEAMIENKKINLSRLMQSPLFVSETMKVDDLIRKMQKAKKHLAIVSDEYGGTSGIVTMEDALEELVGEIYDEHDDTEIVDDITKINDNSYKLSADIMLDELYEILELGQPPETNYPTIGGYLYGMFEHIPQTKDQVTLYSTIYVDSDNDGLMEEKIITLHFTILTVVERRIKTVQLDIEDNQETKNSNVESKESKTEEEKSTN